MLKKKHIYIPIEVLVREINSRILFSFESCLQNYRIYIGSKTGIDKIIKKKKFFDKSGIYFYKSQIIKNYEYIKNIKKTCEKFIVLDEELGISVANLNSTLNRRAKNLDEIDVFFVIGKKMMKHLKLYNSYFKKIAIITGWPKYDFYKKKNINFFKKEIEEIENYLKGYYLFSSNYGALTKEGLNARIKKDPQLSRYKNSKNKQNNYHTFLNSIEDFKFLKKKLFKFLKKNPDFKLVIRPHPADENQNDWKIFEKFPNVKVINKFDIIPWIVRSKGLIHRGCSTAVDSVLLNKPTYYLKPNRELKNSEKNLTYKISTKISDFDGIKYKKINNLKKLNLIKKEINFSKKTTSYNILNHINKFKVKKEYPINFSILENFMYYFVPFLGKIKNILVSLVRNKKNKKNQKMSRFLTLNEIKEKIDTINFRKKKISIREVTREVFEIEKI